MVEIVIEKSSQAHAVIVNNPLVGSYRYAMIPNKETGIDEEAIVVVPKEGISQHDKVDLHKQLGPFKI
ncbi:hypothetical protein [Acetobacter syzygii]|uniref:hypothetical protein n=1 Tax=Acetobacter syzygii TaxID=146476 RepID=UPI0015706E3E|nr:hypothetical protein [Acetobacter syzygii]NSL93742.1 hypothetical protein [Acetobacter syzygii]